ncbi:hypothetical protein JVT61DRAFT_5901 [Boletus reticuloceps]|uniref:Glycosyl transferase family 1 domain-containing protein n=1 Tax=Boletus reticuloceps TaxID=495285 RepID=A0A8I2YJZ6_9AGAM|nr:hypothetical protein JVT61DRAFT_5901 [Boletus reticuloceps]
MAPGLILSPIKDIDGAPCPVMRERRVFPNINLIVDWIKLLGPVRHRDVHDVLICGSIFLNTSLTEAFGIAILEVACTGLYIVSTRVGGVPDILPQDMILFANPDEDDAIPPFLFFLSFFLQRAHCFTHTNTDHPHIDIFGMFFDIVTRGAHNPLEAHTCVTRFYDWAHIAEHIKVVYDAVVQSEPIDFETCVRRCVNNVVEPVCGAHLHYHLCLDVYAFLFSPQGRDRT